MISLIVVPTVPRSLTSVDTTDANVTLQWMEPDMPNGVIARYQVEYRVAFSDDSFVSQNATSLTNATSYIVTGLSPFTEYEFRVAAATRVGLGPYTGVVTTFTTGKFPGNLYTIYNNTVYMRSFKAGKFHGYLALKCNVWKLSHLHCNVPHEFFLFSNMNISC